MPHLTVAQNIFIGREPRRRPRFLLDERAINVKARELLESPPPARRPARPGVRPHRGRPADDRDRARAVAPVGGPHHGRADRGATGRSPGPGAPTRYGAEPGSPALPRAGAGTFRCGLRPCVGRSAQVRRIHNPDSPTLWARRLPRSTTGDAGRRAWSGSVDAAWSPRPWRGQPRARRTARRSPLARASEKVTVSPPPKLPAAVRDPLRRRHLGPGGRGGVQLLGVTESEVTRPGSVTHVLSLSAPAATPRSRSGSRYVGAALDPGGRGGVQFLGVTESEVTRPGSVTHVLSLFPRRPSSMSELEQTGRGGTGRSGAADKERREIA